MAAPMPNWGIIFAVCKFFVALLVVYFANFHIGIFAEEFADLLLCRKCGSEIARASSVIRVPSKLAHRQRNDTVSGIEKVLIQLFKNPDGLYFEVITVTRADIQTDPDKYMYKTWFPGYSWAVSICPKCGQHIGWHYEVAEPENVEENLPQKFIGLIFDRLLEHLDAENLILIPKSYRS